MHILHKSYHGTVVSRYRYKPCPQFVDPQVVRFGGTNGQGKYEIIHDLEWHRVSREKLSEKINYKMVPKAFYQLKCICCLMHVVEKLGFCMSWIKNE